jgi:hypothetical protein
MQLAAAVSLLAIAYIAYNSLKKKQTNESQYDFCPMCNRFEEAIDQYGHCSKICSMISMETQCA